MRLGPVGQRLQLSKPIYCVRSDAQVTGDLRDYGFRPRVFNRTASKMLSLNEEQYSALLNLLGRLRSRIDQIWGFPGTIPLILPNRNSLCALIRLDLFIQNEAAIEDMLKRGFKPESGKLDLTLLPWVYQQHIS